MNGVKVAGVNGVWVGVNGMKDGKVRGVNVVAEKWEGEAF